MVVFFCLFPSLCSFVIPLSHLAYFTSSLSPTVFSLEKCCSLFTNFTHLHFLPHLSLMLVSHLFFPLLFFPALVLSVLQCSSFLFSSLSISSPLCTCPLLLFPHLFMFQASNRCSIFRQLLAPELIGC